MQIFSQTFVGTGKTNKSTAVFLSFAAQTIVLIIGILLPMIYFDALPTAQLKSLLVAPPPPPPPAPPPPPETPRVVKVIPRIFNGVLTAPTQIPNTILMIKEDELPPPSAAGGVAGISLSGAGTGMLRDILGGSSPAAPPPPPVEKKVILPPHVPVGGKVQAARLMRQPKPVYPQLARQARIQGVVKLHALISKEGTIENLTVISGHPLLVPAALEAVKQWAYQPTSLNGEPVGVETEIDVNFTLSQ